MPRLLLLSFVFALALFPGNTPADDHYVSPSGDNQDPYTNLVHAAHLIQDAIDASTDGDFVWIDASTNYLADTVIITKGIELRSLSDAVNTIIHGSNNVRCLMVDHTNAVVRALTIRNGYISGSTDYGAGIYMVNGTIRDCIVRDNRSNGGAGGILCVGGTGLVYGCSISNNWAGARDGGGVLLSGNSVVSNCQLYGNVSLYAGGGGGGLYVGSDCQAIQCSVISNSATWGGGIHCYRGTVDDCDAYRNVATNGGGIFCSDGTVNYSRVFSNSAVGWGGGIYIQNSALLTNTVVSSNTAGNVGGVCSVASYVDQCRVVDNTAAWCGGAYLQDGQAAGTTIAANRSSVDAGGCAIMGSAVLVGCTISNNFTSGWGGGVFANGSGGTVSGSLVTCNAANYAGGVSGVAGTRVMNSRISSNSAVAMGGLSMTGAGSCALDCTVTGNYASNDAAGVYLSSGGVISNSLVRNNVADFGGGVRVQSSGSIVNCLIVSNTATVTGGGIYLQAGGEVICSTVVSNASSLAGGIAFYTGGTSVNTISYFNMPDNWATNGAGAAWLYSCTTPEVPGTGNTTNRPLFIDPGEGNYRLLPESPCVDAGTNVSTVSVDLDGRFRPLDGDGDALAKTDIGAYEYDPVTDSDGDGQGDYAEYMAGTDPANPKQKFEILNFIQSQTAAGDFVVSWSGAVGRVYRLCGSTNLPSSWTNVAPHTNMSGNGAVMSVTNGMAGTNEFYRIKLTIQ